MNSGQGVLWIILWICLNSELLRYHGVQNFAKNDTENAELTSKMLRQQHFLHQRKNLYTKNLYEVFQARQNQRIFTKILRLLSPFSLPIHPRTLSELVWWRSGWGRDRLPRHNK